MWFQIDLQMKSPIMLQFVESTELIPKDQFHDLDFHENGQP